MTENADATPSNRDNLSPTTAEELTTLLAFALRYRGKRRVHDADNFVMRVATERLVEHLRISGCVVMKKPPAPPPGFATRREP